jgi:hypothetical protein
VLLIPFPISVMGTRSIFYGYCYPFSVSSQSRLQPGEYVQYLETG